MEAWREQESNSDVRRGRICWPSTSVSIRLFVLTGPSIGEVTGDAGFLVGGVGLGVASSPCLRRSPINPSYITRISSVIPPDRPTGMRAAASISTDRTTPYHIQLGPPAGLALLGHRYKTARCPLLCSLTCIEPCSPSAPMQER